MLNSAHSHTIVMANNPSADQKKPSPEQVSDLPTPAITPMKFDKPLSGLFAIHKPSGVTSMSLLESMKDLFLTSKLFLEHPITHQVKQTEKSNKKNNQFSKKKKKQLNMIKIGQGGTLDPLASGVLIIGLNSATKKLSQFLNCSKAYRTTGILGCKTDSYDCDGKIVETAKWKHVKAEDIKNQCELIKGEHWQTPPIYSALKMDGKPLYEYARKNIPLPRPIESRRCEIHDIKMIQWKEAGSHPYKWPTERIGEEDGKILKQVENLIHQTGVIKSTTKSKNEKEEGPTTRADGESELSKSTSCKRSASPEIQEPESKKKRINEDSTGAKSSTGELRISQDKVDHQVDESPSEDNENSPVFTLEMTVSSGTYVRTIIHDIGEAVSSAAIVVSLIRTRQGNFSLEGNQSNEIKTETETETETKSNSKTDDSEKLFGCIDWNVFEKAIQAQKDGIPEPCNELGLREWEQQLLKNIQT